MKAWVLQTILILPSHQSAPPSVEYFDTRGQCEHVLGDWTRRAMTSHPAEEAMLKQVFIGDSPDPYISVVVGHFLAMCVPTDRVKHQAWEDSSP